MTFIIHYTHTRVYTPSRIHYKEYLVDKINKNKLDPITMYPILKIKLMLEREEMAVPKINDENDLEDETEEQYNARLINVSVCLVCVCVCL